MSWVWWVVLALIVVGFVLWLVNRDNRLGRWLRRGFWATCILIVAGFLHYTLPHRDVVRPARDGALFEAAVMSNLEVTEQVRCLPEGKAVGCPSSLLQAGDIPATDADSETLNVKLTGAEPARRRTKWKLRKTNHRSGALWTYAQEVGPAVGGAVTHPGGAHEKQCYADI